MNNVSDHLGDSGASSTSLEDYSDASIGSGNERLAIDRLSPLPPLVLISSFVNGFDTLVKLANPGVATIHYNYHSTTLDRLLQYIRDRLMGRKAYSICFVTQGRNPGNFKLISQKTVTLASLTEDREIKDFFTELVSSFLHTQSDLARIDILNSPVEDNADGKLLVQALSKLVDVPVYTSKDIWGTELALASSNNEDGPIKIGTLYFDGQRLKEWYAAGNEMKLDKYEKLRVVGRGAYGQAVLYRRKDDDSKVILKKIGLLDLKKEERQNVLTEIRVLSMLDHPHIVSYYDSFEENGEMMIEMEYAEGGSLQQYLKNAVSPLPELEVLTKFSQMVDAIRYIHMHNILHRDLKTANIFLTRFGSIKLGDFGIAKVLSATHEEAYSIVGTPYYISPEICVGKPYDKKSDIWSLGCILYEMLCLHKTFDSTNLPALVHKIVEGSFEPIKGHYNAGIKRLVKKMLEKNPHVRPSAEQLHLKIIPELLNPLREKAGILSPPPDLSAKDDANTRSFLYYLDGTSFLLKPIAYPFQQRISNIAVGYSHIVAVTVDLDVYSWGDNSHGQLGLEDLLHRTRPVLVESLNRRNIKNAWCGGEFSMFMNENGIVMSCGRGDKGMLGHGNIKDSSKPELIEELLSHDVCKIECGESHVVMLTKDGKTFVWGSGDYGQLGIGSGDDCLKPTEMTVHSPGARMNEIVKDIRCGSDSTVFITDVGRVFACGNNADNKLGLNGRVTLMQQMKKLLSKNQLEVPCCSIPTPIKELGKHRVVDCFMGVTHSVFLTESGLIYTFGRNSEAQLGTGHCCPMDMPNTVKGLSPKPMIVKSIEFATIVASESNSFFIWGSRSVVQSPLNPILSGIVNVPYSPVSPGSGFKGSPTHKQQTSSEGNENSSSNTGTKEKIITNIDNGSNQESPQVRHKSLLETQLAEVPHEQISCAVSTKYTQIILEYSNKHDNKSIGKVPRQKSIVSVHNNKIAKKGSHDSMDKITDGKILSPISIDLVQDSNITVNLRSQGYENIKLEDITCYGPNLVVLIYATLTRREKTLDTKQRIDSFTVGKKLRRCTISAIDLLPEIKPSHPGNLDKVKEMNEEEDKTEAVVAKQMCDQPMSPTTELKGDLKEPDISMALAPVPLSTGIDESHGWFPHSLHINNTPPVEGTKIKNKNQNNSKTKIFARRPSALEVNATPTNIPSDPPVPVETSPNQPSGINRLPTTKVKRQESVVSESELPVSYQPPRGIKQLQFKSIANLPVKSVVHENMKRVHSSGDVAKPPQDEARAQISKGTSSNTVPLPSQRGAVHTSHLENSDNTSSGNKQAMKENKPSAVSPNTQPVMKVKPIVKQITPDHEQQGKRGSNSSINRSSRTMKEKLQAAFEKEKELQKIIDEKSEKEQQLQAQLDELTEKMKRQQRSKICVTM